MDEKADGTLSEVVYSFTCPHCQGGTWVKVRGPASANTLGPRLTPPAVGRYETLHDRCHACDREFVAYLPVAGG